MTCNSEVGLFSSQPYSLTPCFKGQAGGGGVRFAIRIQTKRVKTTTRSSDLLARKRRGNCNEVKSPVLADGRTERPADLCEPRSDVKRLQVDGYTENL